VTCCTVDSIWRICSKSHRGGDLLNTDAEEDCYGNLQQAGEAIQCLDLHYLAFFKAMERCARYAGLASNFVRAQAGAEPGGLQPVPISS
jgi:hypothetical protein